MQQGKSHNFNKLHASAMPFVQQLTWCMIWTSLFKKKVVLPASQTEDKKPRCWDLIPHQHSEFKGRKFKIFWQKKVQPRGKRYTIKENRRSLCSIISLHKFNFFWELLYFCKLVKLMLDITRKCRHIITLEKSTPFIESVSHLPVP